MKKITKDKVIFAMDKNNEPVESIKSGESIVFETIDCFSEMIQKESDLVTNIDFDRVNPATGPLFIEGAMPGDVLKVKINKIELENQASIVVSNGFGLLGDVIEESVTRIMEVHDDHFTFLDQKLPLRKMIGVIGTAPKDEAVATGAPDNHGGNMDTTEITEGATLYLPVNVEGALLALGDLHAAMGDGEIGVSGGEVSGKVYVDVEVVKDSNLPTPMIENDKYIITIVSDEDMKKASYDATLNMQNYLIDNTKLDKHDAILLISLAGDLKVGQVVNPKITMRMEMGKEIIEKYI